MSACKCPCGGALKCIEKRGEDRRKQCVSCGKRFITKVEEKIVREVAMAKTKRVTASRAGRKRGYATDVDDRAVSIPTPTDSDRQHAAARRRAEDIRMARELGISVEDLA